ncbi:MAG: hypothetical protein ACMG57_05075 [Candidatus Dojkabacteria bacterium]
MQGWRAEEPEHNPEDTPTHGNVYRLVAWTEGYPQLGILVDLFGMVTNPGNLAVRMARLTNLQKRDFILLATTAMGEGRLKDELILGLLDLIWEQHLSKFSTDDGTKQLEKVHSEIMSLIWEFCSPLPI